MEFAGSEVVQGAGGAGGCGGAGSEGAQVGDGWSGEVGTLLEEGDEGIVAAGA